MKGRGGQWVEPQTKLQKRLQGNSRGKSKGNTSPSRSKEENKSKSQSTLNFCKFKVAPYPFLRIALNFVKSYISKFERDLLATHCAMLFSKPVIYKECMAY